MENTKLSRTFATVPKALPYQRVMVPVPRTGKIPHFIVNCLMCDKTWETTEKQAAKRPYCTPECGWEALKPEYYTDGHAPHFAGEMIPCKFCGTPNPVKQANTKIGKGVYCDRECYLSELERKFPKTLGRCLHPECCNLLVIREKLQSQAPHCSHRCAFDHASLEGRMGAPSGPQNGRYGKPPENIVYAPFTDRLGRVHVFRSSWEIAFVEQYLDLNGLTWQYERKTFDLGGFTYTPDFWVDELGCFVEVKGYRRSKQTKWVDLQATGIPVLLATKDVLVDRFEVDLSNRSINDVKKRFKVKTYTSKRHVKESS